MLNHIGLESLNKTSWLPASRSPPKAEQSEFTSSTTTDGLTSLSEMQPIPVLLSTYSVLRIAA